MPAWIVLKGKIWRVEGERFTYHAVHLENSEGNEASKGCGKNVAGVKDGNTGGKLLACIEGRKNVQSTGVVWGFCNTKEESSQEKASVITADGRESTNDGPNRHGGSHPDTWADTGDNHVGGNTNNNISSKENGNACLVLGRSEVEILLKSVQSRKGDSITVLGIVRCKVRPTQRYLQDSSAST